MQHIATDGVAWSVCLFVCVCLLVTFVSPAKTTEAFGANFLDGPKKPCIRFGLDAQKEGANFWGLSGPLKSI